MRERERKRSPNEEPRHRSKPRRDADEQGSRPERLVTPQEEAGESVEEMERPPKAEGEREEARE